MHNPQQRAAVWAWYCFMAHLSKVCDKVLHIILPHKLEKLQDCTIEEIVPVAIAQESANNWIEEVITCLQAQQPRTLMLGYFHERIACVGPNLISSCLRSYPLLCHCLPASL